MTGSSTVSTDIVEVARRHARIISSPVERGLEVPGDETADLLLKLAARVERSHDAGRLEVKLESLRDAALDILANPPTTERGRAAWVKCINEIAGERR